MVDRRVSWEYLFAAGVITLTIMAGMYFMGQELSEQKVSALEKEIDQFNQRQEEQDLTRRLALSLPERNCEALNIAVRQTINDVEQLQEDVSTHEDSRKIENGEFDILKKRYMNALLEYWLTTKQIEKRCGSNVTKILYIYNDPEKCPRCQDQGIVLTHYRERYDDRLLVFPLDASLDMQAINLLVDAYNIDTYPAMIIDGDAYEGYKSRAALGDLLDDYISRNQSEG